MIRSFALSFVVGLALLATPVCGADSVANETFQVVHNEPITLRVLNGKSGEPLIHTHLVLFAGYNVGDLKQRLWHEEAITNDQGEARLSNQMANLPFLQVWVAGAQLCLTSPRASSFSVELIRRDGFSTPNRCGIVTVQDAPGVFTVFVKGKTKETSAGGFVAATRSPNPAPTDSPTDKSEQAAPLQSSVEAEFRIASPHLFTAPLALLVAPLAAAAPNAATPTLVEAAAKTALPLPVVASAPVSTAPATPTLAAHPVKHSAPAPAKAAARRKSRRIATTRRSAARGPVRRNRPVLASCPVQSPATKETPVAARRIKPSAAHPALASKP